jgi:uncharacterized integral membrane protein
MNFKITLVVVLVVLALIFLLQNIAAVSVSFLFWDISMSLAVLIFFCLLIGFVIGWFLKSYLSYRKEKKEVQNILNK